jgi:WD40 repeat protein
MKPALLLTSMLLAAIWQEDVITEPVRTFEGHTAGVLSVAFSPDGNLIAAGSAKNLVKLWRVENGDEVRTLGGHEGAVTAVAFDPIRNKLAAGSWGTKLFALESGKQTHVLEAHTGFITTVAYSPNGKTIVTGGLDATARLWDSVSGQESHAYLHPGGIVSAHFTPDGKSLITTGDTAIKVWTLETGLESATVEVRGITCAALSPNGKRFVTGHADKTLRIWNTDKWKEAESAAAHESRVSAAAFAPNGRWFATSGDTIAKLWDAETGTIAAAFKGHEKTINALAFSPDSTHLATGASDHGVMYWRLPIRSRR